MRAVLFALVLVCVASGCGPAHAHASDILARAVMNEAEGEPYSSKLAHAFLFVNRARAGMTLGSSGLDSPKVRARLSRADAHTWADARRAVQCASVGCVPDPTRGALWCENVRKFGVPDHIRRAGKSVVPTVKIGDVQFWRENSHRGKS